LPTSYWLTDNVCGPESKSVTTGKPISSKLQHNPVIFGLSDGTTNVFMSCLTRQVTRKNPIRTYRESSRRSSGSHIRSVGPTVRSASLLLGRTHLSRTTVNLVSGDPGVPMSHKPRVMCRCSDLEGVMMKSRSHRHVD
jgi:hypothetical protein